MDIARDTGWTFEHIATLSLFDVRDLRRRWAVYPPLHMVVAQVFGAGKQPQKKRLTPELLSAFGGVRKG